MARRHLKLTVDITLDEDAVRHDDIPQHPDGDSPYSDSLNLLRTAAHHHTAIILAPYDPQLTVEVACTGIDYLTPSRDDDTL